MRASLRRASDDRARWLGSRCGWARGRGVGRGAIDRPALRRELEVIGIIAELSRVVQLSAELEDLLHIRLVVSLFKYHYFLRLVRPLVVEVVPGSGGYQGQEKQGES